MKRTLAMIPVFALILCGLAGCGQDANKSTSESSPSPENSANEKVVVGLSTNSITDTWNTYLIAAMEAACEEADVTLMIEDSHYDSSAQLAGVENLCVKNVDVMIVEPVETSACDEITNTCNQNGIPLVYLNMKPDTPQEGTWFIGSEEWDAGQIQGDFLEGKLQPGDKVCVLLGQIGTHATTQRTNSVKQRIEALGAEVVDEKEALWDRTKAMAIVEDWIILHGRELKAIAANNDDMALGAVEALTAAGMNDVVVVGVDGTPDGIAAVKDGTLAGTAFQNAFVQGSEAVSVALSVVSGETPQAETWVPFDSITQDNAEEFIALFQEYGF